jgi:hypothetical protein
MKSALRCRGASRACRPRQAGKTGRQRAAARWNHFVHFLVRICMENALSFLYNIQKQSLGRHGFGVSASLGSDFMV